MKQRLTRSAPEPRRAPSRRAVPEPSPADAASRLVDGHAAATARHAAVLQLQRLYGNAHVRGLLQRRSAGAGQVRRDPAPEDARAESSEDRLLDDVVDYLRENRRTADLHLTAGERRRLRGLVKWPQHLRDADLKARLEALSRQDRGELANRAVDRLGTELAAELATLESAVAEELAAAVAPQLPDLAAHAYEAEEAQAAELAKLKPWQRRRRKKRPPFPLVFKYLLRHVVFRQIEHPRTIDAEKPKYYQLRKPYAATLRSTDEPLFPGIYDPAIVDKLRTLSRQPRGPRNRSRERIRNAVASKLLSSLNVYLIITQGVVAPMIREEYASLSAPVRDNVEGGPEGYLACRLGLLNAFGSPSYVDETLGTVNQYYGSLVRADFLQGHGTRVKGASTIVHPEMKTALENTERLLDELGWTDEVVAGTDRYWSTSIRENRNAPAFLSKHSFGMAIDVNPRDNPNLAKFGASTWQFIEDMLGEDVFTTSGKTLTPAAAAVESEPDPEKALAAVETIRAQSDRLQGLFASETALRTRLSAIVRARDPLLSAPGVAELLDVAARIRTANRRTKRQLRGQLRDTLEADFWQRKPAAAREGEEPSELAAELIEVLARRLRNWQRYEAAEELIVEQISRPAKRPSAAARQRRLQPLFWRKFVRQLEAVPESDRAGLAAEVLAGLRLPLEKADAAREAEDLASFLELAFATFARTRRKSGAKIGPGAGLANVAAHGFTNLPPKLITALTSPRGGNLEWLGVHNQDMHHFQLKRYPDLPKATPPPEPAAE